MSVLSIVALVIGGVSYLLALVMLVLILWQEARSLVNGVCAAFTLAAAVWFMGLLIARVSAYIDAPTTLIEFGVRLFEAGFTTSCVTLYLCAVILTGGQGRLFVRIAAVSIGAVILYQVAITVLASGSLYSVGADGDLIYSYGLLWVGLYGLFAGIALIVAWQRRRKLPDRLFLWAITIFGCGVFIELISPQLRQRSIPLLLCAPAVLLVNYTLVKTQIIQPLIGRESQLRGFRDVGLAIASRLQLDEVLHTIATQAAEMLQADGAAIFLKQGNTLELAAVHNMPAQFVGHRLPPGEGLSTQVAESGRLIRLEDYRRDWKGTPDTAYARESFGAVIAAPLVFREDIVGVLFVVVNPQGKRFDRDDVRLLEMLGPQAAVAIINSRLFEQQQELDRMKNQMIRMTSHDLKNPLFSAMSHIELLQEEGEGILTEEMRQDVQTTWTQLTRMERIIRGILDLEKVQSGTPSFAEYDVGDMVQTAVGELDTFARQHGITLDMAIAGTLPAVVGDRQYMIQAVANLVENAIKFTHAGGSVRVNAEQKGEQVIIHVADTGVGIPEDAQHRIFERFFRATHLGMEPVSGTGLGLSLVKAVADAHGGQIWLDSTVGAGTVFHVALPIRGPRDLRVNA